MKTIGDLAGTLDAERPSGIILDSGNIVSLCVAAARFYAGFSRLTDCPEKTSPEITPQTFLSVSEWALIRPLFLLFVERETALQLEASRGLGIDVFGRSTSEIAQDIAAFEAEMSHRAFVEPLTTV